MALDTPVTYHVALLSILAAAYVNSLKLCAGGSQRSYRSGALLNDISVFPDRSFKPCLHEGQTDYGSVSQTLVCGPQVVLGFCPCGPFRLNISQKKTEKIKLT